MTLTLPVRDEWRTVLTHGALEFAAELHQRFEPERQRLLKRRTLVQAQIDAGRDPDFLAETEGVRQADWHVAAIPAEPEAPCGCPINDFTDDPQSLSA